MLEIVAFTYILSYAIIKEKQCKIVDIHYKTMEVNLCGLMYYYP